MVARGQRAIQLPHMRTNPFSTSPLEADEIGLLVGRKSLLQDLGHHIRFGSPRLLVLTGERGSGRTSFLRCLGKMAPKAYHLSMYPESDPATTILNELYCLMVGYDVPGQNTPLIEQLVASSDAGSGNLPLITIDYPGVSGPDFEPIIQRITPILGRLRAVVVLALTPAQLSAWPDSLRDRWDVLESLRNLSAKQVKQLIEVRMRTASNEGWAVPSPVIEEVLSTTGGQPAGVVRQLRDLVDQSRGVTTIFKRKEDLLDELPDDGDEPIDTFIEPAEENDARSRMPMKAAELEPLQGPEEIDAQADAEDESMETEISITYDDDFEEDEEEDPDDYDEDDDWVEEDDIDEENVPSDFDIPVIEELVEPEEAESESARESDENDGALPSLEVLDVEPPDMERAFGGAIIQMQPGTEPPQSNTPFSGLKSRDRAVSRDIRLEDALSKKTGGVQSTLGPRDAVVDTTVEPASGSMSIDSDEASLWVSDEEQEEPTDEGPTDEEILEELPFEEELLEDYTTEPTIPDAMPDPALTSSIGAALRAGKTQVAAPGTPPMDFGKITALSDSEIAVVEAGTGREISPSDAALQAYLQVGRPRLSQIFNELNRTGILAVRKQGRTRLFRISDAARAYLTGNNLEA